MKNGQDDKMRNSSKDAPVGVLDSGVGGIAVLRQVRKVLPHEDYLFIADFQYAPYGPRPRQEIEQIVRKRADELLSCGAKAILIACNTATSAAVETLRSGLDVPVIGMEPAVKPATEYTGADNPIFVMATEATLKLSKFTSLVERYDDNEIIPLPCPGLSVMVEQQGPSSEAVLQYLRELFKPYRDQLDGAAVVMGCTHYCFLEQDIMRLGNVSIFDGRNGTALQLERVLKEKNLLNEHGGTLTMRSTLADQKYMRLLERFYELPLCDGR